MGTLAGNFPLPVSCWRKTGVRGSHLLRDYRQFLIYARFELVTILKVSGPASGEENNRTSFKQIRQQTRNVLRNKLVGVGETEP